MSSKPAWAIPGQSGLRSETLSQKKPKPKQTKTQPTIVFIDQFPKLRTQEVIEDTLQPCTLSSLGPTPCVSALLSSSLFPMCLPCLSPSVCFSWLFSFKVSLCSQCCSGPSVTAPLSPWLLLPCSRTSALPPYPAFLLPLQLHQPRVASGDPSRKGWLATEHLKSLRSVHLCPGCPEGSPETSSSCPCQ